MVGSLFTTHFSDNNKHYGARAVQHGHTHHRSISMSHHIEGLHPGSELNSGLLRPVGTPNVVEADVFPPLRAQAPDPSIFLPYIPEDIAFEEEYEEYLSDLGWSDNESNPGTHDNAWRRLPDFVSEMTGDISDSESIDSIGEIGEEGRELRDERDDAIDENRNNWEVS